MDEKSNNNVATAKIGISLQKKTIKIKSIMRSILEGRPALKAEIEKTAEVAGYLWQNGWAERNGGNITVNITEYADDDMRLLAPFPLGTYATCWLDSFRPSPSVDKEKS